MLKQDTNMMTKINSGKVYIYFENDLDNFKII